MINLPEHHLRLAMEGIYKSRKSLQKWPWEPYEIKAVLFDLGDTILNFGEVAKTKIFFQGAKATHAYLTELGQPVGPFA